MGELKGFPAPARIAPLANDIALAKRLWDKSEQLVASKFTI
jgi:hypothetical protein